MNPTLIFQSAHKDDYAREWAMIVEGKMFKTICCFVLADLAAESRSKEQMEGANAFLQKLSTITDEPVKPSGRGTYPEKPLTTYG